MTYVRSLSLTLTFVCLATASVAKGRTSSARLVERTALGSSLFHYVFEVPFGDEVGDRVRVHRVVETKGKRHARHPRETEHAVLLIHGSAGLFETAFLAGGLPSAEPEQSMAVFLAERGIDVWGIDLAWSLVPPDAQDVSFMADWGLSRQVDEVSVALDFASSKRGKRGTGGLHLLGYSLGGVVGYAVANQDAQRPCGRRRVRGFIPFDTSIASDDPSTTARACEAAAATEALIAEGVVRDGTNALAIQVGVLARTDPGATSPFIPGLTNRQAALVILALPSAAPPGATNPAFHLFAGALDTQTGLPVDLVHVSPSFAFEWLEAFGGGPPLAMLSEAAHLVCGDIDLPHDDFLSDVTVPVLYVGADGGFGASGLFSTDLLGSSDVSATIVDLEPPAADFLDFGHIDLATASSAGFLAWDHVADWIRGHDVPSCSLRDTAEASHRSHGRGRK